MRSFVVSKDATTAMRTLFLPLTALILLTMAACTPKQETVSPVYKPITEAVYASGHVKPRDEHRLYAQTDGVISDRPVREGDIVKAGQLLFRISSEEQDLRIGNQNEALRTAELNLGANSPVLAELNSALASAQAKCANDSLNFARYDRLFKANACTRADYDRAQLSYSTSRNELSAARQRIESRRSQLKLEVDNARTNLRLSQTGKGYYLVQALSEGKIYDLFKEPGELVRKGDALALLGKPGDFYLEISIDELDIAKVRVGQPVEVVMEGLGKEPVKAHVSHIHPAMNSSSRSFDVEVEFDALPTGLYANLTAEANIIITRKERALVIPRKLLLGADSVLVQPASGDPVKQQIKTGIQNLEWVEVTGGLEENTKLVIE